MRATKRSLLEQLARHLPRAELVDEARVNELPPGWASILGSDRKRRVRAVELCLYIGARPRPRPKWVTPVHAELWRSVDARLREFYRALHDGFTLLPGGEGGPVALDDVHLDIVFAKTGPEPGIILFHSGGNAELLVGAKNDGAPDGFARLPRRTTAIQGGLWELLDHWMAIILGDEGSWQLPKGKPRRARST